MSRQPAAQFKAVLAALITISLPHVGPPPEPLGGSDISELMTECSLSRDKAEGGDGGDGVGGGGESKGGCGDLREIPLLRVTTPEGSQRPPQFLPDDIFSAIVWSAKFEGGVQDECGSWSGIPRLIGRDTSIYGSEFPKDLGPDFKEEHPSWSEMHVEQFELYRQGTDDEYIYGEAFYNVTGAWNGTVEFKWYCGWQVDALPAPDLSELEPELVADSSDEAAEEIREIFGI